FFGKGCLETTQAVDPAQRCVETRAKPLLGQLQAARDGLAEEPRVFDRVGNEGINLVELAARNLHADIVQIETHDSVFDDLYVVSARKRERKVGVQAGFALDAHDPAEPQHPRLLAFIDDEDAGPGQEKHQAKGNKYSGKAISPQLLVR